MSCIAHRFSQRTGNKWVVALGYHAKGSGVHDGWIGGGCAGHGSAKESWGGKPIRPGYSLSRPLYKNTSTGHTKKLVAQSRYMGLFLVLESCKILTPVLGAGEVLLTYLGDHSSFSALPFHEFLNCNLLDRQHMYNTKVDGLETYAATCSNRSVSSSFSTNRPKSSNSFWKSRNVTIFRG